MGTSLDDVKAHVAKLENPGSITVELPTEPAKPKPGVKVAIILSGAQSDQIQSSVPGMTAAIKAAGWTAKVFDGQFTPTVQSGLIQQAVQQGYSGIIMNSVDPTAVTSAIAEAQAHHVPIVCHSCYARYKGVTDVTYGPIQTGDAMADWAVANANGSGKIAVFNDTEFSLVRAFVGEELARLKQTCPSCDIISTNFAIAQALATGSPWFASFVAKHPAGDLTSILGGYDPAAAPFVKVAQQLGRTDLRIAGNANTTDFDTLMQNGKIAAASTAIPLDLMGWMSVDTVIREINGQRPFQADNLPVSLVVPSNLSKYDIKNPQLVPATDYKTALRALWGTG